MKSAKRDGKRILITKTVEEVEEVKNIDRKIRELEMHIDKYRLIKEQVVEAEMLLAQLIMIRDGKEEDQN